MPISDTYYLEDSKVWELDSLMKIITSSFIADLINRQISEQKIAQELSNIGKQLRAEQIRNYIARLGVLLPVKQCNI